MTDLDACYFCGTVGGTLERRAVIPERLARNPDAQRSVVLCPTCHEKLETVLEPIVDSADEAIGPSETSEGESTARGAGPAAGGAQVGVTFGDSAGEGDDDPGQRSADDGQSAVDEPRVGDDSPARDEDSRSEQAVSDDPADYGEASGAGATDDSRAGSRERASASADQSAPDTVDTDDRADADGTSKGAEASGETPEDERDRETEGRADDTPVHTADDPGGVDLGVAGGATAGGRVRDYRKVLRLFNNRELPIGRAEARMLAASAYDLDERDVEEFIDVAIDAGHLVETDRGLDFPA